ncbi:hypothetical protein GGS20DRAFT_559484 [Poronia punctata]|nr:hypothetical protein GGS20DRAFT_559484 [Poronia punctata]
MAKAVKKIHKSLHEMLSIFIGPEMLQRVLSNDASLNDHRTHWLVRKSAATAMLQGLYQFNFSKDPSEYLVTTLKIGGPPYPSILDKSEPPHRDHFIDHSASLTDMPYISSLECASRLARPIRWTLVAREIADKQATSNNHKPSSSLWRRLG